MQLASMRGKCLQFRGDHLHSGRRWTGRSPVGCRGAQNCPAPPAKRAWERGTRDGISGGSRHANHQIAGSGLGLGVVAGGQSPSVPCAYVQGHEDDLVSNRRRMRGCSIWISPKEPAFGARESSSSSLSRIGTGRTIFRVQRNSNSCLANSFDSPSGVLVLLKLERLFNFIWSKYKGVPRYRADRNRLQPTQ
ncbi:hypothetical protein CRG98_039859 [Punica granatum]|uniref:Uncharacterized protein n=1 Tax=Punica granatum TaxID=22663 RepID=A0A2I0I739_PUNGR|nr:hypothetical protein CRG98_039859 [Punica granatum]